MLMNRVVYIQVIGCKHDAVKRVTIKRVTQVAREDYIDLPIYQESPRKFSKITNSTSTDVTFSVSLCSKMVAK